MGIVLTAVAIVLLPAACGQGSTADAITRYILETRQIRDIPLDDDGKTDAISGATISIRATIVALDRMLF